MRISDWSSDVCSSDLQTAHRKPVDYEHDDRPSQEAIRQGHLSLVLPPAPSDLEALLVRLSHLATRRVWLAAALRRDGRDARRLAQFKGLSAITGGPMLANLDALYASSASSEARRVGQECVRTGGFRR